MDGALVAAAARCCQRRAAVSVTARHSLFREMRRQLFGRLRPTRAGLVVAETGAVVRDDARPHFEEVPDSLQDSHVICVPSTRRAAWRAAETFGSRGFGGFERVT
jgi:hypothetical protein